MKNGYSALSKVGMLPRTAGEVEKYFERVIFPSARMQYLLATRSYSEIFRSSPKYHLALGCSFSFSLSLALWPCGGGNCVRGQTKPCFVILISLHTLLYQTFVIWNSSKGRSYDGKRPECVLLWITLTFLEKLLLSIHPEQRALAAWLAGTHNKSERRWVVAKTSCRSRFVVLSLRCLAKQGWSASLPHSREQRNDDKLHFWREMEQKPTLHLSPPLFSAGAHQIYAHYF